MDIQAFLNELAEILEIQVSEITPATKLEGLENWDSVNVLSYMALVDQKFGRAVSPDAIAAAHTVEDLYFLACGDLPPPA